MNSMEYVVLVDERDNETGTMEKLQAHREGKLHRAVSVFIFNSKGEMLLQQRAADKYHSANLWTNACCSHPRQGESVHEAARRRLYEEMGISCELIAAFRFVYNAQFENGLTEHEYDHVFKGVTDKVPAPDKAEVADWKYVSKTMLEADIAAHPEQYTEWFKICLEKRQKELFD